MYRTSCECLPARRCRCELRLPLPRPSSFRRVHCAGGRARLGPLGGAKLLLEDGIGRMLQWLSLVLIGLRLEPCTCRAGAAPETVSIKQ